MVNCIWLKVTEGKFSLKIPFRETYIAYEELITDDFQHIIEKLREHSITDVACFEDLHIVTQLFTQPLTLTKDNKILYYDQVEFSDGYSYSVFSGFVNVPEAIQENTMKHLNSLERMASAVYAQSKIVNYLMRTQNETYQILKSKGAAKDSDPHVKPFIAFPKFNNEVEEDMP
jgi:hypothetical protein